MVDNSDIIIKSGFAPRPTRRKASGGVIFLGGNQMPSEPLVKRAISFIDGQNLYHAARARSVLLSVFNLNARAYLVRSLQGCNPSLPAPKKLLSKKN